MCTDAFQGRLVCSSAIHMYFRTLYYAYILVCFQSSSNKCFKVFVKDLSLKVNTIIQPVFASWKIEQELNVEEAKPMIINEQCIVYNFQCDLCDASYVGYTPGHLHNRVKGHKQQSSAIAKHYKNMHRTISQDCLINVGTNWLFSVRNAFHKPNLNVQSDSFCAKVLS